MLDEELPKCASPPGVIARKRDSPTHSRHGGYSVVYPRGLAQRGNLADAITSASHKLRGRSFQRQLGGRQCARAKLVLETLDSNVAKSSVPVAELDEKHAQSLAAGGPTFDTRQCHGDLRSRRR